MEKPNVYVMRVAQSWEVYHAGFDDRVRYNSADESRSISDLDKWDVSKPYLSLYFGNNTPPKKGPFLDALKVYISQAACKYLRVRIDSSLMTGENYKALEDLFEVSRRRGIKIVFNVTWLKEIKVFKRFINRWVELHNIVMMEISAPKVTIPESFFQTVKKKNSSLEVIYIYGVKKESETEKLLRWICAETSSVLQLMMFNCAGLDEERMRQAGRDSLSIGALPGGVLWQSGFGSPLTNYCLLPDFQDLARLGAAKYELNRKVQSGIMAPFGKLKLVTIGQGRTGKTSLLTVLQGKAFDSAQESTKGMDLKRVDVGDDWNEAGGNDFAKFVAFNVLSQDPDRPEAVRGVADAVTPKMVNKPVLLPGRARSESVASFNPDVRAKLSLQLLADQDDDDDPDDEMIKAPPMPKVFVAMDEEEMKRIGKDLEIYKDKQTKFALSLWDFGGQEVFYTLHHVFLTDYGIYLLVFNAKQVLDPSTRNEAINYLEFWLTSKKLHAPLATLILVGTHGDGVSLTDQKEIDNILKATVFKNQRHNLVQNGKSRYFLVDSKTGLGIPEMKKLIEKKVLESDAISKYVPITYVLLLDRLLQQQRDYVSLREITDITEGTGLDKEELHEALAFLNQRGLITYFEAAELKEIVILEPQWLIDALTKVIYDKEFHKDNEKYYESFGYEMERFEEEAIMDRDLLMEIWGDYSDEIRSFLEGVMKKMLLMCDFEKGRSLLIPSLFAASGPKIVEETDDYFNGMKFYIDFSGQYDLAVIKDKGRSYVTTMPFGVFERLVCLCVRIAEQFDGGQEPVVRENVAIISLGHRVSFQIKPWIDATSGKRNMIKFATASNTQPADAAFAAKMVFSMMQGIDTDFFRDESETTRLSINLLIESSEETGSILAEYGLVKEKYEESKNHTFFAKPSFSKVQITPNDFKSWFAEVPKKDQDLVNAYEHFDDAYKSNDKFLGMGKMSFRPLPRGMKYHCFLSYRQNPATKYLVAKYFLLLQNMGYKCWYDQYLPSDINKQAMEDGVTESMCYVLVLSDDLYSPSVVTEITKAMELKRPTILTHVPETNTMGHWQFGDYINNAPDCLKPLFSEVESIPLGLRFHDDQTAQKRIQLKVDNILTKALA